MSQRKQFLFSWTSLILVLAVAHSFYALPCYLPAAHSAPLQKRRSTVRSTYLRQLASQDRKLNLGLAYWIELNRAGKFFKTNNKAKFHSGDQIRFHVVANADAYAYIIMKQGTKGTRSVLFPLQETGIDNFVKRGKDCIVPTEGALQFDENPGIETVGLLLSRKKIDPSTFLNYPAHLTTFVPSQGAARMPRRTRLSVERPADGKLLHGTSVAPEVDLVDGKKEGRQLWRSATTSLKDANMVVIVNENPEAVVSVDFKLVHDK